MRELPRGILTFLFTDIQGSSQLWEDFPAAMAVALERHDSILRGAIGDHDGFIFKTVGDGFFAVFDDPCGAVRAAVATQRGIAGADWSTVAVDFPAIKVRIAIHTGAAYERDRDYFGPAVNRVARLLSATHGGQILLSLACQGCVCDRLPTATGLQDWGVHRLKDLRHAEHIYELLAEGVPQVGLPPRTAEYLTAPDRVLVAELETEDPLAPLEKHDDARAMDLVLAAVTDEATEARLEPEQALRIARRSPADLTEYRVGRIAQWSLPQYRLDRRFVDLTLLVDQGESALSGRWQPEPQRLPGLSEVLQVVPDPAVVVLGAPGSGKSTLLRHLELETSAAALRGESQLVTFFAQLNDYWPEEATDPGPLGWLETLWRTRWPRLHPLAQYLSQGRVLFLLDALNEIPHSTDAEYRASVRQWKRFVSGTVAPVPGNRVVFTCRSLDYSSSLSTPRLRVPQLRLEPMSDSQVRRFLELFSPGRARELWDSLSGSEQLELMRTPYFLRLLIEQVEQGSERPRGRAALFTGFVRLALQREIERENPVFAPNDLLTERDLRQLTQARRWRSPHSLPERGALVPSLSCLAFELQKMTPRRESSQVTVPFDDASRLLGEHLETDTGQRVLRAAEALGVLVEDAYRDEVRFFHQLLQEYFAARRLANEPAPELCNVEWREDNMSPSLSQVVEGLAPADPLPGMPTTRWDETTLMACAMSSDHDRFVRDLRQPNLALAGRCAAQPNVTVSESLRSKLCRELVDRSRDTKADLRARIQASLVLGKLGDPRFEQRIGPHGDYLSPPMAEIPAGRYSIGLDTDPPEAWSPRHEVEQETFRIGRFPVTVAEWRLFMAAGGYEDERWWPTRAASAWREGEGTALAVTMKERNIRREFLVDRSKLDRLYDSGLVPRPAYEQWIEKLSMTEEEFEANLKERYPGGRLVEPAYWPESTLTTATQPVVGVSWFEAQAYCHWLAAQTSIPYRLPTEAEWETAVRGAEGRLYPWGDEFCDGCCNTVEAHVRSTTPVGVFPRGDTPEGVSDTIGNTYEWTSTLWGDLHGVPLYAYPYRAGDGREDLAAPANVCRVLKGSSWGKDKTTSHACFRAPELPDRRGNDGGFRMAVSV